MLLNTSFIAMLAVLGDLFKPAAAAENWDQKCSSDVTACILTANGISVTANFAEGAVNRGRISGGYTAWEIAPNGPMGNINGCNGSSTWNFLEMGDSIYDGTHQGKGHLQAWFRSNPNNKVVIGGLRSSIVGDDLMPITTAPATR